MHHLIMHHGCIAPPLQEPRLKSTIHRVSDLPVESCDEMGRRVKRKLSEYHDTSSRGIYFISPLSFFFFLYFLFGYGNSLVFFHLGAFDEPIPHAESSKAAEQRPQHDDIVPESLALPRVESPVYDRNTGAADA